MNKNPLVELHKYGQSFWFDNINRPLITSGELKRLVDEDGLRGVASNPTIFEKAITESDAYDEEFTQAVRESESFAVAAVTGALTTSEIKQECDILRRDCQRQNMYRRYLELFDESNERRRALGKRRQSAKAFVGFDRHEESGVSRHLFVEALIGKDTVDTMPPATVDAFRDRGQVRATLEQNLDEAAETLEQIKKAGFNLDESVRELQTEGVAGFVKSFENLTAALVKKHASLLARAAGK